MCIVNDLFFYFEYNFQFCQFFFQHIKKDLFVVSCLSRIKVRGLDEKSGQTKDFEFKIR